MRIPATPTAERIVEELGSRFGIDVGANAEDEWGTDGLGHEQLSLGRWYVSAEDEERGLYEGDGGVVTVQVVGSAEHHNERMEIRFTPDGNDPGSGPEAVPFEDITPVA